MQKIEDMRRLNQKNVDATVRGFAEINKGIQHFGVAFGDYARRTSEKNTTMLTRLAKVGSLQQALELQSEHVRTAYDDYLAETSRFGNIYAEMARGSLRPFERLFHGA